MIASPRTNRMRRGFTMVELLVSMTLLAAVGTILAKLMLDQQRFYQKQGSQINVRRELRTTMSAIPSDLRSLSSSGGDLIDFNSNSITFRNVLGTGVVCAKPNSSTVDLPPLNMARTTLTSWYTQPQVGDSVFAFNEGLLRGAEDDAWFGARIVSIVSDPALCPGSVYTDAALDAGKRRWRVTVSPALPDSVKIGAAIRFERSTRYSLQASPTYKFYLNRSEYTGGAWGASVPISGPFVSPSGSIPGGVRFSYFDSLGVAVTNVANSRDVARIDIQLVARGANMSKAGAAGVVQDSLTIRIALRNRQ